MNRTVLRAMLMRHEGVRLKPYRDTAGKLTIGVGRNLDDVGISDDEAADLLDHDISRVWAEMPTVTVAFGSLDDVRQHVLMDMAFNLGSAGLRKFVKMLAAVEARDFEHAAAEMLASAWAREVGDRAVELAHLMRYGAP